MHAFQDGTHRAAEEDKKAVWQGQAKIVQLGSALSARLQPAAVNLLHAHKFARVKGVASERTVAEAEAMTRTLRRGAADRVPARWQPLPRNGSGVERRMRNAARTAGRLGADFFAATRRLHSGACSVAADTNMTLM